MVDSSMFKFCNEFLLWFIFTLFSLEKGLYEIVNKDYQSKKKKKKIRAYIIVYFVIKVVLEEQSIYRSWRMVRKSSTKFGGCISKLILVSNKTFLTSSEKQLFKKKKLF